jgi:hypothetical protein
MLSTIPYLPFFNCFTYARVHIHTHTHTHNLILTVQKLKIHNKNVAWSHLSCVINIWLHQVRPNLARFDISAVTLLGLEVFSVTLCHWVVSRCFERTLCLHQQGTRHPQRWRHYIPSKHQKTLIQQYSLMFKTWILKTKPSFTLCCSCITDTIRPANLCLPQANLTIYQKGAYYSEIKFF